MAKTIETSVERLRDPCVLVENGTYYMYGTGWKCYKNTSGRLDGDWECLGVVANIPEDAVADHWAPEVHKYNGGYYMFTTYRSEKRGMRGCCVMRSDSPEGPFVEISDGHVTPDEWDAIDATLYVDEKGHPWMVFVHEWTCMPNKIGRMAAAKLSEDLTRLVSEPIDLFGAKDAPWAVNGVTDGCWMYRTEGGELLMLWSNWDKYGYCVGVARSDNGRLDGHWIHEEKPLFSKGEDGRYDGGHGMIFTDTDGQKYLSIHSPNSSRADRPEKPVFIPIREKNERLHIVK